MRNNFSFLLRRSILIVIAVLDEAQVLNSLQKPRKIGIRGSDGKVYNLLCKPKDDLRKDQRLMEFNNMINRFLKKDVESSKRRMCKFGTEKATVSRLISKKISRHTLSRL